MSGEKRRERREGGGAREEPSVRAAPVRFVISRQDVSFVIRHLTARIHHLYRLDDSIKRDLLQETFWFVNSCEGLGQDGDP